MSGPNLDDLPLRERIRWLRLHGRHGRLSHDRMADALGTTRQTVIGWEKGARPKEESIRRLAAFFDKPADIFRAPATEAVTLHRLADRLEELESALERLLPLLGRVADLQEQLDDLALRVDAQSPRAPGRKPRAKTS